MILRFSLCRASSSYWTICRFGIVFTAFCACGILIAVRRLADDPPPMSAPVSVGMEGTETRSACLPRIVLSLSKFDGHSDFEMVCDGLAELRSEGKKSPEAAAVLLALLPEHSALYGDRSRSEILLLRGALFATLAETGCPLEALPLIRAELATSDDPYVFAAACRAAANLGPQASAVVPDLLRPFGRGLMDDTFSLKDPRQQQPLPAPTTAKLEAMKALAAIGPRASRALATIQEVAAGRLAADGLRSSDLQEQARLAIIAIDGEADEACKSCCAETNASHGPMHTTWLEPSHRSDPGLGDISLTDQGNQVLCFRDLLGNPLFLSFFYTQCDNPQKCSRTVTTMAQLKERIVKEGLASRVRIILITLDPAFDDLIRLREYVMGRGFHADQHALVARTSSGELSILSQQLQFPVNFNAGRVSVHGVSGVLLDKGGRVARTYHSVLWDNEQVVRDLRVLIEEE